MRKLSLLMLFVFLTIAACSNSKEEAPREHPRELSETDQQIDAIIHDAVFEDLDGNEIQVSDFKGKVVLVDFWETWCGPCLQVFPAMDSLQNEYSDDFVMIAANLVTSDSPEDVQQFKDGNDYTFTYALDVNNIGDKVITHGIPFKVFIDPQGYLIKTELGSAGTQGDYEKAKAIIEEYKIEK